MDTKLFSALADLKRLQIIELLRERPYSVNEIADTLHILQPLASKHLRILSEAGLLAIYPIARQRLYGVEPRALKGLYDWALEFEPLWDTKRSILNNYLQKIEEKRGETTPTQTHPLVLRRRFDSSLAVVWKAWTVQDYAIKWWSPEYFTNISCEIDLRLGGDIHIEMQAPDGEIYPMIGTIREVKTEKRLGFTASSFGKDGKRLFTNMQTVTFTRVGRETEIVLEVYVMSSTKNAVPFLAGMEQGWSQSLNKLSQLLTTSREEHAM